MIFWHNLYIFLLLIFLKFFIILIFIFFGIEIISSLLFIAACFKILRDPWQTIVAYLIFIIIKECLYRILIINKNNKFSIKRDLAFAAILKRELTVAGSVCVFIYIFWLIINNIIII
ncbi:MAG: hypothetical protein HQL96_03470 [Magnetococcales bacterium]|nr:hypothetical protein [Magnetococcales bacterium]